VFSNIKDIYSLKIKEAQEKISEYEKYIK